MTHLSPGSRSIVLAVLESSEECLHRLGVGRHHRSITERGSQWYIQQWMKECESGTEERKGEGEESKVPHYVFGWEGLGPGLLQGTCGDHLSHVLLQFSSLQILSIWS